MAQGVYMQYDSSVQRNRPAMITLICILGFIYSGYMLLASANGFISAFYRPMTLLLVVLEILVSVGFIAACVLILQGSRAGKTAYHVVSIVWLLVGVMSMFVAYSSYDNICTVASGPGMHMEHFQSCYPTPGAEDLFVGQGIALTMGLGFLVVFNILLCQEQYKGYWRRPALIEEG